MADEIKTPKPGEPGYYNPPTVEAGVTHSPQQTEEKPEPVNYDDLTVAELKDLAHKRGVELHSDMLKDDIIKALKKAE